MAARDVAQVGAKAANLATLRAAGFAVPAGFCITAAAYRSVLEHASIRSTIAMEIGRKPLDDMRWEELWDAALRIRSAFLALPLPEDLRRAIGEAAADLTGPLAVRSSAPGEDSASRSFAGLHESVTDVHGEEELVDAVRVVWSSLWSDAALLYRRELELDPTASSMAVLVQEMVDGDRSGVAFARDPRDLARPYALIEVVPGPCSLLVDGQVDPDRWEIERETGRLHAYRAGDRGETAAQPLLADADLAAILHMVLAIERSLAFTPDVEWTGGSAPLTALQARPITSGGAAGDATAEEDERRWYLSLRPGDARLRELRTRVADELIPQLQAEGERLAAEALDRLDDAALAAAVEQRVEALARWKKIYWDEFIPFAHGVRRLATYYNDAVRPDDPYEFVGLLADEPLIAARRNASLAQLATQLARQPALRELLASLVDHDPLEWDAVAASLAPAEGGQDFVRSLETARAEFLDITYGASRLSEDLGPLLRNLLERASSPSGPALDSGTGRTRAELEQRLYTSIGPERHDEARELLETGRLSWKLRDDDNVLVARLESQLLRAIELGLRRLQDAERASGETAARVELAAELAAALHDRSRRLEIAPQEPATPAQAPPTASGHERPRQLIGQPASPGVATGTVRTVADAADLGRFRQGEILVCDAIQPTMTHVVPLASAIVERRGGMLIHGAIIARELRIPCVNGVRDATALLGDGDLVTVDGHLGIVTVGEPEFELERRQAAADT